MIHKEIQHDLKTLEQSIAGRLRLFRKMAGYTQKEMAHKLACTFQQYQKYENGLNRISVSRLVHAANILNKPLLSFIEPAHKVIKQNFTLSNKEDNRILTHFLALPAAKQAFALNMFEKLKTL